jgi:hypothetical protein
MVTCVFCGLDTLASVEDVIPKWVRYALDPASASPSGLAGCLDAEGKYLVQSQAGLLTSAPAPGVRPPHIESGALVQLS